MQHILGSNKLIISQGSVQDVETVRREYARPDGVIITQGPPGENVQEADRSFDFAGWAKMFEQSVAEIEGYGVNTAGMIEGEQGKSGRAIALLQAAGLAELGPYILAYRGWKVRVYRAIWNAVQKLWQAERWVRVTDDEGLAQFLAINQMDIDPNTGQPALVNAVGSLDVDIILDEGPDTVNMMQDMYETLSQIVPALAPVMPPVVLQSLISLFIQSSPLPSSAKKSVSDAMQQAAQAGPPPDPEVEKAKMQMQIEAEKNAQNIQLEREKAEADLQLEREKTQAEMTMEQERLQAQMQLEQQKAQLQMATQGTQMQMDQERHASELQMQREKSANDIEVTRQKSQADMELSRAKTGNEIEMAQAKGATDRQVAIAKDPDVARRVDSMDKIVDGFSEVQREMAEAKKEMAEAMQAVGALGDLVKKLSKPRRQRVNVLRDANNRIVGADVQDAA
jgi:hypothetical protein